MAYIMTDKKRYQMTEPERTEREKIKAVHKKLRAPLRGGKSGNHTPSAGIARRYDLLAWAFVRGFKFRRCERNHHTQIVNGKPYEHMLPCAWMIWERLVRAGAIQHDCELPEFAMWEWERIKNLDTAKAIEGWLADPAGAIAAPAPKLKKPYSPVAAA